jgi:ankyrin repeat protein
MKAWQRNTGHIIIWLQVFAASMSALSAAENSEAEIETTSQLVVMIQGDLNGSAVAGAGIIFGSRADQSYVVTANHVVRRSGREATDLRVLLKQQPNNWFPAQLTPDFDAGPDGLDLAVLSVPGLRDAGLDPCELPQDRLGLVDRVKRGTAVFPLGSPRGVPWGMPVTADRAANLVGDKITFESPSLRPGYSGGPLMTNLGRIVGIIQQDQEPYGVALSIDRVLQTVRTWGYPVHLHVPYNDGSMPLHLAAWEGDNARTLEILSFSFCGEINAGNDHAAVPLHIAVAKEHLDVVQTLLAKGAKTNLPDLDGDTPLHWAAEVGTPEIVHALIAAGADVNAGNKKGWSPLHWSVTGGHKQVLQVLIDSGAQVDFQGKPSAAAPLHLAVRWGRIEIAKALLDAGADASTVETSRGDPATPLGLAAWRYWEKPSGGTDLLTLLLSAGAKVYASELCGGRGVLRIVHNGTVIALVHESIMDLNDRLSTCDTPDDTLLGTAADGSPTEALGLLVEAGADVNAPGFAGWTPATRALKSGQTENAEFLVLHGGELAWDEPRDGVDLLWAAVQQGGSRSVDNLIASGVDVNGKGSRAYVSTPLHTAIELRHEDIVTSLIQAGGDLSHSVMNLTPLARAAKQGETQVVEVLLQAGVDPDASNNFSETALHFAAEEGHREVVERLIAAGAEVNPKNNQRKTPLALATDPAVKALLEAHGGQE